MAAGEAIGSLMWQQRAMNQVHSAATVGASSESRCQSASGLAVRAGRASCVVVATYLSLDAA